MLIYPLHADSLEKRQLTLPNERRVIGLNISALTDIGRVRKINEDSYKYFISDKYSYAIVADGMGGHLAGEVASKMAVDIIGEYIDNNLSDELDRFQVKEVIRKAFLKANSDIYNYSCDNEFVMGMGTTATLCMIYENYIIYAHVGDSRAYKASNTITQITRDHSYVQELVKLGQITPEEAKHHPRRNYITRAMGVEDTVKVDTGTQKYNSERILICSDGLYGEIDDDELFELLSTPNIDQGVKALVNLANERGGADNITAVIMEGEKADE